MSLFLSPAPLLSVCMSCPGGPSHMNINVVCVRSISPLERLFVLKNISRPQQATKVKIFVGISLQPLCCRDPALPTLFVLRQRYAVKRACASTVLRTLGATPSHGRQPGYIAPRTCHTDSSINVVHYMKQLSCASLRATNFSATVACNEMCIVGKPIYRMLFVLGQA